MTAERAMAEALDLHEVRSFHSELPMYSRDQAARAMIAALRAAGWVVVPVVATEEIHAAYHAAEKGDGDLCDFPARWAAMLAAAEKG